MKIYSNEQDAARGILGEAVKIINQSEIDYVILGGWIPYLFVDLLLNDKTTKDQMEKAADLFKANGYHFAAKNKFQLHKLLNVAGEQIIFHVDFLHRKYAPDQEDGLLAFYLAAPEVENDRRALNVFYGMRRARKEGRYMGLAPIGYITAPTQTGANISPRTSHKPTLSESKGKFYAVIFKRNFVLGGKLGAKLFKLLVGRLFCLTNDDLIINNGGE
jgi:hypothetical protein